MAASRKISQAAALKHVSIIFFCSAHLINVFCHFHQEFAIVKFHLPENDEFDVAPLDWTKKKGNNMICYWPSDEVAGNQKRLIDLVTKKAVVDKITWGKFNITILAKFGETIKVDFLCLCNTD